MYSFNKGLFILLLFGLNTMISQNSKEEKIIDSLSLKTYEEIDSLFYDGGLDSLSRLYCAKAYLKRATEENDTIKVFTGYYFMSDVMKNDSIYINHCDSLINITKNKPNHTFPAYGYYKKGWFFHIKSNYKLAIESQLKAYQFLNHHKNEKLSLMVREQIATYKLRIGKYKEAIEIYKDINSHLIKNHPKYINVDQLKRIPLRIAMGYTLLKKNDSARHYNYKALQYYKKVNDSLCLFNSYYSIGFFEFKNKNYNQSIKFLNKVIPSMIEDENPRGLIATYSMIGESYKFLKLEKKALKYHLLTDSVSKAENIIDDRLKKTYYFLTEYYKKEKKKERQLNYINDLLRVNEVDATQKMNISKALTDEYDTPKLLEEKKKIEQELENKLQKAKTIRYTISSFLLLTLGLLSFQFYRRKKYKRQFLEIVNNTQQLESNKEESLTPKKTDINISEDIIESILKALANFEKNNVFLDSKVNLNSLAKSIHTNSNYLSKVINHHKNKSFSNYINDLRIEYTIDKLKNDTQFKKYSIKGISEEVGFKNAESFSKAFEKKTALKPSYFIKELEKMAI